jgi:hypothetical protein
LWIILLASFIWAPPSLFASISVVRKGGQDIITSKDFTRGVLAINTNKTIYTPGESAYLQMAALDYSGDTLCNAHLILKITNPKGGVETFSTTDGIVKNDTCGTNNVTDEPDYYIHYRVKEPGEYQLSLKNVSNGYEITDSFEARDPSTASGQEAFFDVERIGATRINPFMSEYTMRLIVTANEDFKGEFIESVPDSFKLKTQNSNVKIITQNSKPGEKQLVWDVDWKSGEVYELSYTYQAPKKSPEAYLLGPMELRGSPSIDSGLYMFKESRRWQIASDAIGGMENIVYNAASGSSTKTVNITGLNISGSNKYLLVAVCFNPWDSDDGNPNEIVSVTLDPGGGDETALALIDDTFANDMDDSRAELWGVVNPPDGSNFTVRVIARDNMRDSDYMLSGGAWPLTGVKQSDPTRTVATNADESSNANVDVDSAADEIVFGCAHIEQSSSMYLSESPAVESYHVENPSDDSAAGGYDASGTSTVTLNWDNSSDHWAAIGVSIKPEPAPANDVTVSTSGTQTSTLNSDSTNNDVGGTFVITDNTGTHNVTAITIAENGTVNAQTNLDNIKLYYDLDTSDPYDCESESYLAGDDQYGSTDTDGFSAANGTSAFTETVEISTTKTMCVYVVLDVGSGAAAGETIEIEITDPSSDVSTSGTEEPGTAVALSGTTTITIALDTDDFTACKKITIASAQVSGPSNLSNFPAVINLTEDYLKTTGNGGIVTDDEGDDIIFFASDQSTQLDHEVEVYVDSTGEYVAWVEIPTLDYNDDTVIYMYYGHSSITTSQENAAGVWDANYVGVWHLEETPTVDSYAYDSSNSNDGTFEASMTTGDQVAGRIDGSLDFDASDDQVEFTTAPSNGLDAFTICYWVSTTESDTDTTYWERPTMIGKSSNGYCSGDFSIISDSGNIGMWSGACTGSVDSEFLSATSINDGSWYHVCAINNDTNINLYVNTTYIDQVFSGDALNSEAMCIGNMCGTELASTTHHSGKIDELHMSNIARSTYWINTEYNNQKPSSTFYSVGGCTPMTTNTWQESY